MKDSNGQLLSGYKLLESLNSVWKKLDTNSQKYIATTIAGTTQLNNFLALMNNFEHAMDATADAQNAMGSAAKENAKYMEGLEAKTNAARASFEKMANAVLDSDLVKGFLDLSTAVFDLVDKGFGAFIVQTGLLTGLLWGGTGLIKSGGYLASMFQDFTNKADGAVKGVKKLSSLLKLSVPQLALVAAGIIGVTVAIRKLKSWYDETHPSIEEAEEKINSLTSQLKKNREKLEEINALSWTDRSPEILAERDALIAENEELERQIALEEKRQQKAAKKVVSKEQGVTTGEKRYRSQLFGEGVLTYEEAVKKAAELSDNNAEHMEALLDSLEEIDVQVKLSGQALRDYLVAELEKYNKQISEGIPLTDQQRIHYDSLMDTAIEQANAYQILGDKAEDLNGVITAGNNLLEVYKNGVIVSKEAVENLTAKYPALKNAVQNTEGVLTINGEKIADVAKKSDVTEQAIYDLIAAEIAANNQQLDFSQQIASLQNLAIQAGYASEAIMAVFAMDSEQAKMQIVDRADQIVAETGASFEQALQQSQQSYLNNLWKQLGLINKNRQANIVVDTDTGTSTKKEKTEVEKLNEALEKTLKLYEDRAWFLEQELPEDPSISDEAMEKYKNIQGQRVEIFKQAQAEILKVIEKLKELGLDENDEAIRELKKKWWGFENEIKDISKSIAKAQEEAAKRAEEAWRDALENKIAKYQKKQNAYETLFSAMVDKIDEEIKELNGKRDAIEEYWNDKIAKVQEANDRLEEQIQLEQYLNNLAQAQNQKLLTFTNGQFQYVGDMDAVGKAQAELDAYNRELALQEEIRNMEEARDKALEIIDSQIKNWEDYKLAWGSVVENYQKKQDELIVLEELGIELEGELWKERLENLDSYVSQYEDLMDRLNRAQKQLNEGYSGGSSGGGGGGGRGDRDDSGGGWTEQEMNEGFTKPSGSSGKKPGGNAINKPFGGSSGVTGGSKPLKKHAKGTLSAPGGLSWVGEEGPEIRMVNSGDTIFSNEASRNLWDWSKINPNNTMGATNISVGNVTLPSVTNAREFVGELKNMAYQRAYKRA